MKRMLCLILSVCVMIGFMSNIQLAIPVKAEESNKLHQDLTIKVGDVELVSKGTVHPENYPKGISYDAEKAVLTLDNFKGKDSRLAILNNDGVVTIKLIGKNELLDIYARTPWDFDAAWIYESAWIRMTGDGALTTAAVNCERFIMESGTLNVTQTADYFENNDTYRYAFYNENYEIMPDGAEPNCYKFLGGEVNLDCTSDVGGKRVGMDVQSGNIEIRNAKVHIDLGDNPWLGVGIGHVGYTSDRKPVVSGGTLTMENGTLEVSCEGYQAYLFKIENKGEPLHYYLGTSGPEKEVSFEDAFVANTIEGITRYESNAFSKGYLLITNEKVKTVEPVKPAPEPSDSPDTPETKEYTDVPLTGKWYSEAVYYATAKGYMAGTGNNKFNPDGTVTRGTIAQILYAAEGKPSVANDKQFSDVASNQWYAKAVNWAAEKKLVAGYGGGKFGPNDPVTRQQMVAIMYQYAKMKGFDLTSNADLSGFRDRNEISTWAVEPMKWAVGHKIISGTGNGIEPNGTATRAQIAVILQAFDKNVRK